MISKKESCYDLSVLKGRHYSKSNALINAKGTTSLLAQKIFSVGIQQAQLDETTGQLVATLYGSDLRRIFANKSGSFYDHIKEDDVEFTQTEYFNKIAWLKDEIEDVYDPDYDDVLRVAFMHKYPRAKCV